MTELDPLESDIQKQIVAYLRIYKIPNKFKFFSVPNERINHRMDNKLKAMGMETGVTDIVIDKDMIIFFMEVKTRTGKLRKDQIFWRDECKRTNTPWCLVRSFDEARIQLDKWGIIKI